MDLRQIKVYDDDFGLMTYDPAFMNTASCRSAITYIDGDAGILQHRGYPIEQLAEQVHLPRGRLPADLRRAADQRRSSSAWMHDITHHTFVHENIKKFIEGFRYDAHPMGMLLGASARSRPSTRTRKHIDDPEERYMADRSG